MVVVHSQSLPPKSFTFRSIFIEKNKNYSTNKNEKKMKENVTNPPLDGKLELPRNKTRNGIWVARFVVYVGS